MSKPKRQNKTEAELIADVKKVEKVKEMRRFVKDDFYPILLTASTSIDDAKYLVGSISNIMMEQFLAKMKEVKFSELHLEEKLDPQSPQYEDFKKMLELFNDKDVFNAKELIEGMKQEIELCILTEMKERKLESLKTNWFE
jgi:hypothetical protein